MQGTLLQAMVGTGAKVTVLCTEVYNLLRSGNARRQEAGDFDAGCGCYSPERLRSRPLWCQSGAEHSSEHRANLDMDAGTLGGDYSCMHDLWPESASPGGSSDSDKETRSAGRISCLVPCSFRCGA